MLGIALDRHDINCVRLMRMNVDGKSKIAWQVAAHFMPRVAGIIAAHHVPVLLHEKRIGTRWMHGNPMNTMPYFRLRVRDVLGMQAMVNGTPGLSSIVSTEGASGGNRNEHAVAFFRIQQNRVETHSTGAWLPAWPGAVTAQSCEFLPGLAAVARAEKSGIFRARINRVRIGQ